MKKNLGFTIIEMLIYMGILLILLLVLTEVFNSTLDVQLESEGTSSVVQDGHYILSRLTYDLNQTQNILVPVNPGDQGPTLNITIGGVNEVYTLSGQNLTLTKNGISNNLNSSDTTVSNLNFRYLVAPTGTPTTKTISITFTLTSVTAREKGPETETLQTTLGLRKN